MKRRCICTNRNLLVASQASLIASKYEPSPGPESCEPDDAMAPTCVGIPAPDSGLGFWGTVAVYEGMPAPPETAELVLMLVRYDPMPLPDVGAAAAPEDTSLM